LGVTGSFDLEDDGGGSLGVNGGGEGDLDGRGRLIDEGEPISEGRCLDVSDFFDFVEDVSADLNFEFDMGSVNFGFVVDVSLFRGCGFLELEAAKMRMTSFRILFEYFNRTISLSLLGSGSSFTLLEVGT
jgi:hypothetical protein